MTRKCRNNNHKHCCDKKESKNADIKAKNIYSKYIKSKIVKARKIYSCKVDTNTILANNVIIEGVNVKDLLERPAQSTDYSFDALEPEGIFGDRTPKKPPTVNQDVFDAMLLEIKDNVIPQLCARFNKGRKRLNLPSIPTDIDIVGSISLPILFKSFPDSTDPEQERLFQYNTSLGWNLEIANTAIPLGQENQPSSICQATFSGNIMTVTSVSFGFVQQGAHVFGIGIPEDIIIVDQLTKADPDGSFFKEGTYLLGKIEGDVCNPADVNINLPDTEVTGFLAQGLRIASIYLQYGYIDKNTGNVKVVMYDLGNRQFQPTIDFDPTDDPLNLTSWGEKFAGYRSITSNIAALIFDNMPDPDDTGCLQLVILRETGIVAFFPSDDDKSRAISTNVINPNCVSNCTANGNTSSATTEVTVQGL